jgi:hypothetical protein
MSIPPRRTVFALAAVVGVVVLGVGGALVAAGQPPAAAVAPAMLAGLFALVVAPLVLIARRVGSSADDPLALERRLGSAAGRSNAELDALADWNEERGRLADPIESLDDESDRD